MKIKKLNQEEIEFFEKHGYEFSHQQLIVGVDQEMKDYLIKRIYENINKCGLEGYEEIREVSLL